MKDDAEKISTKTQATLHTKLKELRKGKQLKQGDLADYLGVSRQHYSSTERGAYDLTLKNILKLSSLYDVSIDYLLGLTEWNRKPPKMSPSEVQIIKVLHEINDEDVARNILEIVRNIKKAHDNVDGETED